jgi:hypothetical protein
VIYDLQHRYYPQFFSPDDRYYRDRHLAEAARLADHLVCISEYVRGTVLEQLDVPPDHVHAVHIRLPSRLPEPTAEGAAAALARFGLQPGRYLLYPANFWVHKNHAMLLTAFGIYRARHPESDLRLVCTGAPGARMDAVQEAAAHMALADWTTFTGFLSDEDFAALLHHCRALMFPSLYEGFGMPPLEAMALGKPVLCSDVTSLPEVAGDAALYFDARKPHAIAAAIHRLETEPELVASLVARGRERVAAFADTGTMAAQYLEVFRAALASRHQSKLALHGVYPDGWTGARVVVTYGPSDRERYLEMALATPKWAPFPTTSAHVEHNGQNGAASYRIAQGEAVTIRCPLPPRDGFVEVLVDPVFQPSALGLNADDRTLGCICQAARLISPGGTVDLLAERMS